MSSAKILNAYFEASEEDRKEFLRVLSHFYKDNRRVPLQEGMESLPSMKASVNRSQLTLPLCKVGVHSAASNDQSRLTSGLIDFFIL